MRRRLAAAAFIVVAALMSSIMPTVPSGASQWGPTWTIMVYMANDVSNPLPWEDNINSMESASQAFTSIVALLDNPGDGDSALLKVLPDNNVSTDPIVSYEIDDGGTVIPAGDEVDMADPATLRDFVVFCANNFPADRLVLVLWGHGYGWHGLCPDKTGLLTLPELSSALSESTTTIGRTLDIMVVDACTQATFEMFAQISPYVDYFVGAENNIPYYGLPYGDILNGLATDHGQSMEEFGSLIVEEYIDYAWATSPYSATLGAFNLTRLDGALTLLDEFSRLGLKYNSIFHGVLHNALNAAEYYDTPYYVDFLNLMAMFASSEAPLEMRMAALQTSVAFREIIVAFDKYNHPDPYDGVDVDNASGAIIFAPTASFPDETYQLLELASGRWEQFSALARLLMPDTEMTNGPTLDVVDTDDNDLPDTAYLEWPDPYPEVEVYVYRPLTGGVVQLDHLTSANSNITITGHLGELVLSASATLDDGRAATYQAIDTVLHGLVQLEVVLTIDGASVTDDYDVLVTSPSFQGYALESGGSFLITLTVPNQADVGEMVMINVSGGSDGELVQSTRFVVQEHDSTLTIELYGTEEEAAPDDAAILAFSILPAALILLFALMLYVDYRKNKK